MIEITKKEIPHTYRNKYMCTGSYAGKHVVNVNYAGSRNNSANSDNYSGSTRADVGNTPLG